MGVIRDFYCVDQFWLSKCERCGVWSNICVLEKKNSWEVGLGEESTLENDRRWLVFVWVVMKRRCKGIKNEIYYSFIK